MNIVFKVARHTNKFISFYLLERKRKIDLNECIDGKFLVATKNGLFMLDGECISKLKLGEYYGITICNEEILVLKKGEKKSQLLKLSFFGKKVQSEILINDLPRGCHQIDYIEDSIYITDTYNNSVLKYDKQGRLLSRYFPVGKLKDGRLSENYAHMNSIYSTQGKIYIVFHNETVKSGRNSQIFKTDLDFESEEILETEANSAHNVVVKNGQIFVCDSANNRLLIDNKTVVETKHFTRGLSLTDNRILLGGSDYAKRSDRKIEKGAIYILDYKFNTLDIIIMPGMVQEIRRIDGPDYSLSRYSN